MLVFVGYALIQIPGLLLGMFDYIKQRIDTNLFSRKPREEPITDRLFNPKAVHNDEIDHQEEVTKMWHEITKRFEKIEKHLQLNKK